MLGFEEIRDHLQAAHVNQLRSFSGVVKKAPEDEVPISSKQDIMAWINEQEKKGRIAKAKANRVTTPKDQNTPDWSNAIFAVIESASMYLRRDEDVQKAIKAAQENDDVSALRYLRHSQVDIEEVAEKLGLKFIQLCDLADVSGEKAYSGAFSGIFVSDAGDCKFVGVAFKGTSNWKEIKEDMWAKAYEALPPILYGTKVHSGFYFGLFDTFGQGTETVQPFALIMNGIKHFDENYYLHVTGHSLGGAYATFLHCELNRLLGDPQASAVTVKDIMTFGSPRTGLKAFANKFGENMQPQQNSWRFANKFDPVPMVPKFIPWGYTHVDAGYKLYKNSEPTPIPSERAKELEDGDATEAENPEPEIEWTTHGIAVYYKYVDRITA